MNLLQALCPNHFLWTAYLSSAELKEGSRTEVRIYTFRCHGKGGTAHVFKVTPEMLESQIMEPPKRGR